MKMVQAFYYMEIKGRDRSSLWNYYMMVFEIYRDTFKMTKINSPREVKRVLQFFFKRGVLKLARKNVDLSHS